MDNKKAKMDIAKYLYSLQRKHISDWGMKEEGDKIVINIKSPKMRHDNIVYRDSLRITFAPYDSHNYRYEIEETSGTHCITNIRAYNVHGCVGSSFLTESPVSIVRKEIEEKIKWCEW